MINKESSPKSFISDVFSNASQDDTTLHIVNNDYACDNNSDYFNHSVDVSAKKCNNCGAIIFSIYNVIFWCVLIIFCLASFLLFPFVEIIVGSIFFEKTSCDSFISISTILIIKGCANLLTSCLSFVKIYEKYKFVTKSIVSNKYAFIFVMMDTAILIFESVLFWNICDSYNFNTIVYNVTYASVISGIISLFLKSCCIFPDIQTENDPYGGHIYF